MFAFEYVQQGTDLAIRPTSPTLCSFGTLEADAPLTSSLSKSGHYDELDPNVEFYRQFFDDPELRLPPGVWRITAIVNYYDSDQCEGPRRTLRAALEIEIKD